jgi:hypothetical protein
MGRTTRQSLSILLDGLYMCFFRSMLGLTTQKFVFFFLKWSVKKHYFRVRRRSTILTRPKIETVFFPSSIILVCFCVMIITVFMGKPSRIMSSHKYNCPVLMHCPLRLADFSVVTTIFWETYLLITLIPE